MAVNMRTLANGASPGIPVPFHCTQSAWVDANKGYYQWYYTNYPQLIQRGIDLPASFSRMKSFYIIDMADRNLTPQMQMLNCYEALFSYLLGRIDGTIVFEGRSWLTLTIQNIPGVLENTFGQLTSPFGIPLYIWAFGAAIIIIAVKK